MLDLVRGLPVFFDYNNDGLSDVLVGNYGYTDICIYDRRIGTYNVHLYCQNCACYLKMARF